MEPIHRQPLAIQVASRIRDLIATDQFPPGTPLKEVNLCKQLSVSRTPLREALKQLIAEGLVEQIPYRGVVVCNPDQASIEQMLELLGALEGFAGEMACLRATREEIDAIRVLTQQMHETYEKDERLSYYKINQSIHRSIVEFSKNKELIRSHERLNSRLYRIRFLSNRRTDRWHTAIEEHDAILRNLEQREGLKLNKLLREHLGHTWTKVKDLYDS
jgi:DNA-binding GntR family transcriptional regulator|tara:strand:- start:7 stop:657 length:651 start_codon:yes stop_codon:yes gene_type:complete